MYKAQRFSLQFAPGQNAEKVVGTKTVTMHAKRCRTLRSDQYLTMKTIQAQSNGSSPFKIPPNMRSDVPFISPREGG